MTAEEAINQIAVAEAVWGDIMDSSASFKTAIEALEKQIPKKPLNPCGRYFGKAKGGNCPCCGAQTNSSEYTYCRKCGQKLLWE